LLRASIYARHEVVIVAFRNPRLMHLAERAALAYLKKQVADPVLREQLKPSFTMGCKRVLLSDDYYPALTQPNVELVTAGIREVTPAGIVDAHGTTHELDTIVYATGFHVNDPPFAERVRGRGGRTLAEVWAGSPEAFLGTTVAGFPNLFLMTGPNTGLGHNSMILMIESQLRLIMAALEQLRGGGVSLEPRAAAQAAWVEEVRRGNQGTVWTAGGCSSWYLDENGRNSTLWPWTTYAYARRASFEARDYLIER
ncbi:MAG TPA: 4-hydroxyacetophenone monooxygenase, partial [Enhygromyxa sp.]|nr:4-hydroxyacetophenone monooxygenase [Enhygromyxa sp.]